MCRRGWIGWQFILRVFLQASEPKEWLIQNGLILDLAVNFGDRDMCKCFCCVRPHANSDFG